MKKVALIFIFLFVGQLWSQIELVVLSITKKIKKTYTNSCIDSMGVERLGR